MKIAVLSDTHGLLRPEVMAIIETCDVVIHAGDVDKRELVDKLCFKKPIYLVRGNNDKEWAAHIAEKLRFRLGELEFIMVHNKKDLPWDLNGVDIVIFGHSHKYLEEVKDGRLWLNPGSCGRARFGGEITMAVLHLEDGSYKVEKIMFSPDDKIRKENERY